MPRVHVPGNRVTVPAGADPADGPVDRSVTATDVALLAQLEVARDRVDVLRRRHDLLLDLLGDARRAVDDDALSDAAFRARTRTALARADDALDELEPADRDATPTGSTTRGGSTTPAGLRAALTWEPLGGVVSLGVQVVDPGGDAVPGAGGPFLDLDWAATNRLVAAARAARDGAWGAPA